MKAWRSSIVWFDANGVLQYEPDGLLVAAPNPAGRYQVVAVGGAAALQPSYAQVPTQHWPGSLLAPGFVDMHLHHAQMQAMAAPSTGLLPWLNDHIFPREAQFANPEHAHLMAQQFVQTLLRHGVTTAMVFSTIHAHAVDAVFAAAQASRMRLITGLTLMDRHAPANLMGAAQQSLRETETLLNRWHGVDKLGYAITPRFAPSCTNALLWGAGELASQYPQAWVQTHLAENQDEVAWVRQLYPHARSYLDVYAQAGLLRPKSIYAHCIYLDDADRHLMHESQASAAVCPSSNFFLGSGLFDFAAAQQHQLMHGLASDVGAGTSFSPFETMKMAYLAHQMQHHVANRQQSAPLTALHLWWLHTQGAAKALGLGHVVGNLAVGCDADFLVMNLQALPMLALQLRRAQNIEEILMAVIMLADDRVISHVFCA
jgi:guanine deaminase